MKIKSNVQAGRYVGAYSNYLHKYKTVRFGGRARKDTWRPW